MSNNQYSNGSGKRYVGVLIAVIFALVLTVTVKLIGGSIEKNISKDKPEEITEVKAGDTTEPTTEAATEPAGGNEKDSDNNSNNKSAFGINAGHEYIVCNGEYTLKEAEDLVLPGYHLATITSLEESNYIKSLISSLGEKSDGYWLGADDSKNEGVFTWCTGEAFDYNEWPEGQPDNTDLKTGGPENYLGIWESGIWNDFAEDEKLGFILEKDAVMDFTESASGENQGHHYIVVNGEYTYKEAQKKQIPGYHLLTTSSFDEYNYVVIVLIGGMEQKSKGYWLGADDTAKEGEFRWCTDEEFSFTNWPEGQPDNTDEETKGPENYLGIWDNGTWNDFSGNQKFGFVLERD